MLKWLGFILLVLGGLTAAVINLRPWERFKPVPPAYKTEKIKRGEIITSVTSTGTVNPIQTVLIGSQVSGKVKDVLKFSNDSVKKDEVLARLDTDLLESEKRSAEVRLSQVRAQLSVLKVERENLVLRETRQKSAVQRKKISVQRAGGAKDLAAKNLKRYLDLLKVDATTQTEIDIRELEASNSARDLELMEIDLRDADIEFKQIIADGRQLDAKEEQASADIQQAEAVLARAKTNLGYATIYSPIDGVVLQHLIEPGQTIAASFQTPNMFKIASDLSEIRIDAQLDEADVGKIKQGQEVTFDVDAYRNETFSGTVSQVRLQSETKGNLVTYPVLVQAKNPKDAEHPTGKLLPGMTAGLKLVVSRRKDIVLLPSAALRFIPPAAFAPAKKIENDTKDSKKGGTHGSVFVVNGLGMLETRSVRVGDTDGDNYELLEGEIKEGDAVVVGIM
jgi:HlyD family secretion protein